MEKAPKPSLQQDLALDQELEENQPFPLLIDRIQSMFIDFFFIITLVFIISALLDKVGNTPNWVRVVLFFALWGVYEPVAVTMGCTLGQYIKRIRVMDHGDESKRINLIQSFFRYILKMALGWFSFLTVTTNPEKRAIHDFVSGSIMLKV